MVIKCKGNTGSTYELFPLISKNIVTRNWGNKKHTGTCKYTRSLLFFISVMLLLIIAFLPKSWQKTLKADWSIPPYNLVDESVIKPFFLSRNC